MAASSDLYQPAGAGIHGVRAEERGQGKAIARNLMEMSDLKKFRCMSCIGEGGWSGALALAVADRV